jgi:VWFA-related protein
MKTIIMFFSAILITQLCAPVAGLAQSTQEQSFLGGLPPMGMEDSLAAAGEPDSKAFADGTRAINESRWTDAVAIFSNVIQQRNAHADGALYWKAYAENKLGETQPALDTCGELRRDYPRSRWIDECGALEIEIRSKNNQPVQPKTEPDENLKLLALNAMMQKDEPRAVGEIQEILESSSSENLKEKAVFILAQGRSNQAQQLLGQLAMGKINPAQPNPVLQAKAARLLRNQDGKPTGSPYPASGNGNRTITLDVVVTDKSGAPTGGLQRSDFQLFDNKKPQDLVSVRAASAMSPNADPPVEVYLVYDAINVSFVARANQRQLLMDYFNQNGKVLALPTSLLVLSDKGISEQNRPTRDGAALLRVLDASYSGLMQIKRYEGLEGARMREEDSLKALNLFAVQQSKRPGRKLFIWLGEGWSVYSRPNSIGGPKRRQSIYDYVASLSTALREARITLYEVLPDSNIGRSDVYMQYVKGLRDINHADLGDLLLPVLATQTGGQVLMGVHDLASLIDRCVMDTKTYYVLTYNPPPAAHPDEFHDIEIKVDRPGLKARTRNGYYSQP